MDNLGVGIKEDGKTIPTASSALNGLRLILKILPMSFLQLMKPTEWVLPHLTSLEIKIESITDLR